MIYRPSNSILERIRGLFKRRVGDAEFAYLGDSHGEGARVDVPGKTGFVYIHFPNGKDENGNALYSTPMIARATGTAYLNFPGAGVYVAYGYDGELEIKAAHYAGLDQAGIDTRVLNPLNQQSKFVYPWQLTYGLANAVGTTLTGSFLVTVKSFLHFVGNTFQMFDTPLEADKPDLESYVPGANEHRYAALWVDTYTNTATVTTSTTQPLDEPMDLTDIQELVTGRPADGMPLKAFYLSDDQSTLRQTAREVNLRQHMATPHVWGFPHTLTSLERVRPNYTLVVGPYTASGGGALTIESGGRVLNVHKSNVSASAPTMNDDSDDGYDIGSRWLNTTTGILYIATAVTVGAAVWTAIAGSGAAPATATYLLQVANASLPNAQAMGALATGLVKNTTTTGVQSIALAGTDYTSPTGAENLSNKTITLGSINNTPIGATTPNTGAFTTATVATALAVGGVAVNANFPILLSKTFVPVAAENIQGMRIIPSMVPTTATTALLYGANITPSFGGTGNISAITGVQSGATVFGSGAVGTAQGMFMVVGNSGAAAITNAYGGYFAVYQQNPSTGGSIGTAYGGYFEVGIQASANGTITNAYGNYVRMFDSGPGSITNAYAFYAPSVAAGTNLNYAIYTNAGLVRFGDQLSVIGSADRTQAIIRGNATQTSTLQEWQTSGATVLASVSGVGTALFNVLDSSGTGAITNALTLGHNIAGTPAAGFGTGLVFQAKSSTTNDQALGAIDGYWNVETHATRASQLDIAANYTSTKQVGFSVRGDTGGVKTSVNGMTPVAPQTYGVPTGTLTRTTFDTSTVTLPQLAERLAALIVDSQAFGYVKA